MSLIDNGPHTVSVRTSTTVQGDLGTKTVLGPPQRVEGVSVQPRMSNETDGAGTQVVIGYQVIGRGNWPGGHKSRVTVVVGPYPGEYDQEGEPNYYGMSKRTAHYDVALLRRGAEVK